MAPVSSPGRTHSDICHLTSVLWLERQLEARRQLQAAGQLAHLLGDIGLGLLPGVAQGGDIGGFKKGDIRKEIEDAVWTKDKGFVTDPINVGVVPEPKLT